MYLHLYVFCHFSSLSGFPGTDILYSQLSALYSGPYSPYKEESSSFTLYTVSPKTFYPVNVFI